jgi:hypothetical protein
MWSWLAGSPGASPPGDGADATAGGSGSVFRLTDRIYAFVYGM